MSIRHKAKQASARINEILVLQPISSITKDQLNAIRESVKSQLADDPRFIVVYPHINVHYMQPGDVLLTSLTN